MATARQVLDIAAAEVGYVEGHNNWNQYSPEIDRNQWQNQPWCGVFVRWCMTQAGMDIAVEPSPVYTPSGAGGYRRLGRWIDRNGLVLPGDVVFFDWGGSTSTAAVDHVGFVEDVLSLGWVQTIEGNTSADANGSQSNGGGVYRRKRPRSFIAGFGRPLYTVQAAAPLTESEEDDVKPKLIRSPDGAVWALWGLLRVAVSAENFELWQFFTGGPQAIVQCDARTFQFFMEASRDVQNLDVAALYAASAANHAVDLKTAVAALPAGASGGGGASAAAVADELARRLAS